MRGVMMFEDGGQFILKEKTTYGSYLYHNSVVKVTNKLKSSTPSKMTLNLPCDKDENNTNLKPRCKHFTPTDTDTETDTETLFSVEILAIIPKCVLAFKIPLLYLCKTELKFI
jgi:hypothetical protein